MRSSFRKIKYGHTSMLTIIHFFLNIYTWGWRPRHTITNKNCCGLLSKTVAVAFGLKVFGVNQTKHWCPRFQPMNAQGLLILNTLWDTIKHGLNLNKDGASWKRLFFFKLHMSWWVSKCEMDFIFGVYPRIKYI